MHVKNHLMSLLRTYCLYEGTACYSKINVCSSIVKFTIQGSIYHLMAFIAKGPELWCPNKAKGLMVKKDYVHP